MSQLFAIIQEAVNNNEYRISRHAGDQCRLREIMAWQVVHGLAKAKLIAERPDDLPEPSIVVRQLLENGDEVEVVWSWNTTDEHAILVTVYFLTE